MQNHIRSSSNGVTLDSALDTVMLLPSEERDTLIEIVSRRQSEEHHDEWLREANETIERYRRGEIRAQSVQEIMSELDMSMSEDSGK